MNNDNATPAAVRAARLAAEAAAVADAAYRAAVTLALVAATAGRDAADAADAARAAAARVATAVAGIRRVTRRPVEAPTRRPVAETAAFLVNAYDGGHDAAERAARRWDVDAVAGVPFADRIDERQWSLNLLPDGSEVWQTVPDPVDF